MTSRIRGFHRLSPDERLDRVVEAAALTGEEVRALRAGLGLELADSLVENAIGEHGLPLGIATNFLVNGREMLVPLVVEESSVVAAASNGARIARPHGGFRAQQPENLMIAQVQLRDVPDADAAERAVRAHEKELVDAGNAAAGSLPRRGGGVRGLEVRHVRSARGRFFVVHVLVDVRDAMGANAVNTVAEALAPRLADLTGGRVGLRILSNLADRRVVRAEAVFDRELLGGDEVVEGILDAWAFADADPYRAATHNKGILNGIDAVVLATGNDWRAVEAGAHAFAARDGRYRSLTRFEKTPEGHLSGHLELPLSLGIVGGTTKVHPVARASLKILGVQTARELAEITASVGLAQNLAALRALADEGIQQGHMRLHAKNLALQAGVPDARVADVVEEMLRRGQPSQGLAAEVWRDLDAREG